MPAVAILGGQNYAARVKGELTGFAADSLAQAASRTLASLPTQAALRRAPFAARRRAP
ncbi:hypothetical protein BN2476_240140 [Paraburkholderia piptadeniae]|uniref:Uncharacterized protein n=1 Tax=Paraburkholderia piptadeniae TaxID=1701573 RepID=A0A1N7RZ44_9BURK|nr:hypothetical protein BN2476_240140 [Paraburkholderia piptadeniae]